MVLFATISYLFMITIVILFQFCLIGGAPWGRVTQGGNHIGPLPLKGRIVAIISVLLLVGMGASIASAANFIPNWPIWTAYVAITIQLISIVLNIITSSRSERLLWVPVTSLMFVLAVFVVFSK